MRYNEINENEYDDEYDIDYESVAKDIIAKVLALPETDYIHIAMRPFQNMYTDQHQPAIVLTDLQANETGTGIGTRLMKKFISMAEAEDFSIYTDASGPDSERFYKKLGFEPSRGQGHQLAWHPPLPDWVK